MKYLSELEAVVSFLAYVTKFIQQSLIECPSLLGPGLRAIDTGRSGQEVQDGQQCKQTGGDVA